jgi:hypothetical protein
MVVYLLTSIGILTPEFLKTYRRHAIVVIMVVAAIITCRCSQYDGSSNAARCFIRNEYLDEYLCSQKN